MRESLLGCRSDSGGCEIGLGDLAELDGARLGAHHLVPRDGRHWHTCHALCVDDAVLVLGC